MKALLFVLFYAGCVALAVVTVSSTLAAARLDDRLMHFESPEEKYDSFFKDTLEGLSFGIYRGGSEKLESVEIIRARRDVHHARSRHGAWALAALTGILLLTLLGHGFLRHGNVAPGFVGHLLGVSALYLGVGIVAPVLTVSAHREMAVIGEAVLQYETKSVLGTVGDLYFRGNRFLAILLALFSIIAPGVKLALSCVALMSRRDRARRVSRHAVDLIGKWSMTDVFVVAVLLAFLALDSGDLTAASTGIGLYYFAGYGLLSLVAGHLLVANQARWRGPPDLPRLAARGDA